MRPSASGKFIAYCLVSEALILGLYQGFLPKLQRHLLPRIYSALLQEAEAAGSEDVDERYSLLLRSLVKRCKEPGYLESAEAESDAGQIYFHAERIYEHSLLHINYTSYDVRRETDIVNPQTSRRDVMCLRQLDKEQDDAAGSNHAPGESQPSSQPQSQLHRFLHVRVLGVFHANAIYRGRGSKDLRKRRFDFLLVRRFEFVESNSAHRQLDRLVLAAVDQENAIDFLDPSDVIRASHIIPRYMLGRRHPDSDGTDRLYPSWLASTRIVSKLAKDWEDWSEYYVNRWVLLLPCLQPAISPHISFVDRDMLMRYHWGLGVGHTYSHGDSPNSSEGPGLNARAEAPSDQEEEGMQSDTEQSQEQEPEEADDSLANLEEEELEIVSESGSSDGDLDVPEPDDGTDDDRW